MQRMQRRRSSSSAQKSVSRHARVHYCCTHLANVRKSSWAGFCDSNVLKNSQPQSTGTPKEIRGSAKDSVLRKTIPVGDLVEKADILRVVLAW